MSKKLTKEDIKGPDAFISASDKVVKFIEEKKTLFITAFVAAVVIGGGAVTFDYIKKNTETRLQAELFSIQEQMRELGGDAQPLAAVRKAEDLTKLAPAIDRYKAFISANPSSQAGAMAALELSDIYFSHKSYEASLEPLQTVVSSLKPSDVLYGLAQTRLAASYMALNQNEKAIESLKSLSENKHQKFLHGDSWLRLGLAQQRAGQVDEAVKSYEKVISDFPESVAARTATSLVRFISFSK